MPSQKRPYYARVWAGSNFDYNLTRNADFDTANNDDLAHAQRIFSNGVNNRQRVAGHAGTITAGTPDVDYYRVSMAEGGTLNLETFTPSDQGGDFANTFDPKLVVYDAKGNEVAEDDNSAPDARNALLSYPIPKGGAGTYYIEVLPSDLTKTPTLGEYVLEVHGAGAGPGMSPSPGAGGPTPATVPDPVSMISLISLLTVHREPVTGITSDFLAGQPPTPNPNPALPPVPQLTSAGVDGIFATPDDSYPWVSVHRMRQAAPVLTDESWWESV